jgi:predicted enzyme related to lactoylglutathione lyase
MHKHHSIDYIEIKVLSVAAAKEFYAQAFGFQFTDYGPGYAGILGDGGKEQGGLVLSASVSRGGPLVILFSENLEETRKAVREAGGTICVDIFDFPGGRRFHFLDPSGNELAAWSKD